MKKAKKQVRWIRFRHKIITMIAYCVLAPYIYCKYHVKVERFREERRRNYLILLNHQTAGCCATRSHRGS